MAGARFENVPNPKILARFPVGPVGKRRMPIYRVYFTNKSQRVVGSETFEASADPEATMTAVVKIEAFGQASAGYELWRDNRRIAGQVEFNRSRARLSEL